MSAGIFAVKASSRVLPETLRTPELTHSLYFICLQVIVAMRSPLFMLERIRTNFSEQEYLIEALQAGGVIDLSAKVYQGLCQPSPFVWGGGDTKALGASWSVFDNRDYTLRFPTNLSRSFKYGWENHLEECKRAQGAELARRESQRKTWRQAIEYIGSMVGVNDDSNVTNTLLEDYSTGHMADYGLIEVQAGRAGYTARDQYGGLWVCGKYSIRISLNNRSAESRLDENI